MSKISQLHADLTGQAAQLGFHSIEEAEINGYEVDYEKGILVEGRDKAHKAWLEEKQQTLNDLDIVAHSDTVPFEHKEIVKQAYKFIREQCHD